MPHHNLSFSTLCQCKTIGFLTQSPACVRWPRTFSSQRKNPISYRRSRTEPLRSTNLDPNASEGWEATTHRLLSLFWVSICERYQYKGNTCRRPRAGLMERAWSTKRRRLRVQGCFETFLDNGRRRWTFFPIGVCLVWISGIWNFRMCGRMWGIDGCWAVFFGGFVIDLFDWICFYYKLYRS